MNEALPLPVVHSIVAGPIQQLSVLKKSLLFAELANASYFDELSDSRIVEQIGFSGIRYFDRDGVQAYMFWNDIDCIVACRGTEPNEWNDIKADANAVSVVTGTFGRVHKGFNQASDE